MRHTAVVIALVASMVVGCHHGAPPAPPRPAAPPTPPPAPPPAPRGEEAVTDEYSRIKGLPIDEIDRMGLFGDIHFDFDRSDLRPGDRRILEKDAEVMKKYDFLVVTVGGHCDERGTVEYNLALGDRRARTAVDTLVSLGVPASRLKAISYGKESPTCRESSEDCWAKNRRDHLTVTGKTSGR